MRYRHYGRAGGLTLIAVAAVAVLAACGSSGSGGTPSGTSSSSGSSTSRTNALAAYVSCLSKNGVTITLPTGRASDRVRPSGRPSGAPRPSFSPGANGRNFGGGGFVGGFGGGFNFADPSTPPSGVNATTWQNALNACKSALPSFGPSGGGGFGGGQNNTAFQAYRNCLSSHGVTFTSSTGPTGVNTADPKVAAALKTCAPLRPTGGPGAAPAPSPTS